MHHTHELFQTSQTDGVIIIVYVVSVYIICTRILSCMCSLYEYVYMHASLFVCVCMCVCVREGERTNRKSAQV